MMPRCLRVKPTGRVLRLSGTMQFLFGVSMMLAGNGSAFGQSTLALRGEEADISLPCVQAVQINVDPQRSRLLVVNKASAAVSARVEKDQGAPRVVVSTPSCQVGRAVGRVEISIGKDMGVILHDSPHAHFTINGQLASLEASLTDGEISAEEVESLDINIRGTEDVSIAHLARAAQLTASDTARVFIADAQMDALSATLSNRASLVVGGGLVSALTLSTSDEAAVRVDGAVTTAMVTADGSGPLTIPKASGTVTIKGRQAVNQVSSKPVVETHADSNAPQALGRTPKKSSSAAPVSSEPSSAQMQPVLPASEPVPQGVTRDQATQNIIAERNADQPTESKFAPITSGSEKPSVAADTVPPVVKSSLPDVASTQVAAPVPALAGNGVADAHHRQAPPAGEAMRAGSASVSAAAASSGAASQPDQVKIVPLAPPVKSAGASPVQTFVVAPAPVTASDASQSEGSNPSSSQLVPRTP